MTDRNNDKQRFNNGAEMGELGAENAADHLAVLSLGGLTNEEEQQVELLIANDPELAIELQEFSEVVDHLPYFPEPMEVSKKVEDMLFRRVEANAQARFKISPSTTQIFKARIPKKLSEPVQPVNWFEELIKRPIFATSIAAAALMFAGIIGLQSARLSNATSAQEALETSIQENLIREEQLAQAVKSLEQELEEAKGFVEAYTEQLTNTLVENQMLIHSLEAAELSRDDIATQVASLISNNETLSNRNIALEERVVYQNQILGLFESENAQAIEIKGTDFSPGAAATIVFNPETDLSILLVTDLPQLNENQVYQVLLIRGDEHDTAETFTVNSGGEHILIVESPSPMSIFDTVGVSIEPRGGSDQRTGEIILLGDLSG